MSGYKEGTIGGGPPSRGGGLEKGPAVLPRWEDRKTAAEKAMREAGRVKRQKRARLRAKVARRSRKANR